MGSAGQKRHGDHTAEPPGSPPPPAAEQRGRQECGAGWSDSRHRPARSGGVGTSGHSLGSRGHTVGDTPTTPARHALVATPVTRSLLVTCETLSKAFVF